VSARTGSSLSQLTFVAFDVETTGLDSQTDKIVQVGAVRFDRRGAGETYEQLVNPGRRVPEEALAIHGITDAMLAAGPPMREVLPRVVRFFGDSVLVAHNAQFDIGFFEAAFAEAGVEPPPNPILCTRELAHRIFPGLPDYKLTTLVRVLNIRAGRHHRALADASCDAEIFRRCLDHIDSEWHMAFSDLLAYHGAPFRFGTASAQALNAITEALKGHTSVRIEYRDARGKSSVRDITPLSIEEHGRYIRVIAFCHLRGENRTFRLDSIKGIL